MRHPNIFSYLDYREYLQACLNFRRARDPEYSYATFAAAAGLSRGALPNVLAGRRHPTSRTLDGFARALDLSPKERNFLGLLVELAKARTVEERRQILAQMADFPAFNQTSWIEDKPEGFEEFGAQWYYPVIREIAQQASFVSDPNWIAEKIVPPISVHEAAGALETLKRLGLLIVKDDGQVDVPELRVLSRPDTAALASLRFHREAVPRLVSRIEEVPADLRHLVAATFMLPEASLPEAKAVLTVCIEKLINIADETTDTSRRAYQLAIQLVPVSEVID